MEWPGCSCGFLSSMPCLYLWKWEDGLAVMMRILIKQPDSSTQRLESLGFELKTADTSTYCDSFLCRRYYVLIRNATRR